MGQLGRKSGPGWEQTQSFPLIPTTTTDAGRTTLSPGGIRKPNAAGLFVPEAAFPKREGEPTVEPEFLQESKESEFVTVVTEDHEALSPRREGEARIVSPNGPTKPRGTAEATQI